MDYHLFQNEFSQDKLLYNEPMSNWTSFKIGGPADLMLLPADKEDIKKAVLLCAKHNIPHYIMGKGSNILVKDKGFRGVVICIGKTMEAASLSGEDLLIAESGITLAKLAGFALENELAGLEFASGIPGCLGGALYMNAGAYGGEMKDVVTFVTLMDEAGNEYRLNNSQMAFGYRTSIAEQNGHIILGCEMKLTKGNPTRIKEKMQELNSRRKEKQPLDLPSAGSTFKRPEGYFAGKLIEDAGLRGFSYGGAQISEKHCGFVVNFNHATAQDVLTLIELVKEKVYNEFKIELKPEIRIIGES